MTKPDKPRARRWRDELNFLLTNRVPRIMLTRFMGWFSKIEQPWVCALSLGVWRRFSNLDLSDARETRFKSLHSCFTRELKPGARVIEEDPALLVSPCDAIVGACGAVDGDTLLQAKGLTYTLDELFAGSPRAARYRDGCYVTLRLTATMYHRFHAPHDGVVQHVTYVSGDVWNVNPPAVQRVAKLYCRNERALIHLRLAKDAQEITLAPVAAILVASMRLKFADVLLHLKYRGPNEIPCNAVVRKGEELGWFEHGSTIIVFAPRGFTRCHGIEPGARIRMGQALLNSPARTVL